MNEKINKFNIEDNYNHNHSHNHKHSKEELFDFDEKTKLKSKKISFVVLLNLLIKISEVLV
ncbi:MAG: hypothetical protein ACK4YF_08385, partial [Exilispira sp.]